MKPKTSFTFELDEEQQAVLHELLATGNYRPCKVPYTIIAVEAVGWKCRVNLYTSGKCLVQGGGAEEFVLNILEPVVLKEASLGYEDTLSPENVEPHMGIDESGKGDYFGPMVVAAAYVNEELAEAMRKLDVRDSKLISSDAQALRIGAALRGLLGNNRFTVIKISNPAYNRLYSKMRSVNRMLAWAHARCIENLLTTIPNCPRAVSDQFGSKEGVERALMTKGREIVLEQRPRAESDIAVAAASILAREGFLRSLEQMKQKFGRTIPKGASSKVREVAVELVKSSGPAVLLDVAKCHFRTTDAVLSAAGRKRSELPPEGQVVSKDYSGHDFRKSAGRSTGKSATK